MMPNASETVAASPPERAVANFPKTYGTSKSRIRSTTTMMIAQMKSALSHSREKHANITVAPLSARSSPCTDATPSRSEEHTSELQSHLNLVCRLLLEKKKLHQYCNFSLVTMHSHTH